MTTSTFGGLSVACFMIAVVAGFLTYAFVLDSMSGRPTMNFVWPVTAVIALAAGVGAIFGH